MAHRVGSWPTRTQETEVKRDLDSHMGEKWLKTIKGCCGCSFDRILMNFEYVIRHRKTLLQVLHTVFPLIVKFCRKEPFCGFLWGTWHPPPFGSGLNKCQIFLRPGEVLDHYHHPNTSPRWVNSVINI